MRHCLLSLSLSLSLLSFSGLTHADSPSHQVGTRWQRPQRLQLALGLGTSGSFGSGLPISMQLAIRLAYAPLSWLEIEALSLLPVADLDSQPSNVYRRPTLVGAGIRFATPPQLGRLRFSTGVGAGTLFSLNGWAPSVAGYLALGLSYAFFSQLHLRVDALLGLAGQIEGATIAVVGCTVDCPPSYQPGYGGGWYAATLALEYSPI